MKLTIQTEGKLIGAIQKEPTAGQPYKFLARIGWCGTELQIPVSPENFHALPMDGRPVKINVEIEI